MFCRRLLYLPRKKYFIKSESTSRIFSEGEFILRAGPLWQSTETKSTIWFWNWNYKESKWTISVVPELQGTGFNNSIGEQNYPVEPPKEKWITVPYPAKWANAIHVWQGFCYQITRLQDFSLVTMKTGTWPSVSDLATLFLLSWSRTQSQVSVVTVTFVYIFLITSAAHCVKYLYITYVQWHKYCIQ